MPTSLARYAASAPAGVLGLACLELSHSAWSGPERRVMDSRDWTVTIGGGPVTFTNATDAGAWMAANGSSDDTGMVQRALVLDDVGEALYLQIESVRDSAEKVQAKIYLFLSSDLSAPVYSEQLSVEGASPEGGKLTLTAATVDIGNRIFPRVRHTLDNTPGLRGRK